MYNDKAIQSKFCCSKPLIFS